MTLNNRRFSSALRLAARRQIVRWLRKLFDWLEERLHAAEVKLRNDLAEKTVQTEPPSDKGAVVAGSLSAPYKAPITFLQWEARRSGVSVKTKLNKKGRHLTAREFDLRFAR